MKITFFKGEAHHTCHLLRIINKIPIGYQILFFDNRVLCQIMCKYVLKRNFHEKNLKKYIIKTFVWFIIWWFKLNISEQEKLHSEYDYSFTTECVIICWFKYCLREHEKLHLEHENGLTPECVKRCDLKCDFEEHT